jgi:hypothetical protein
MRPCHLLAPTAGGLALLAGGCGKSADGTTYKSTFAKLDCS